MKTLYLLCGAPFSGKTTLAKLIASQTNSQYLSLDDLMRQRGLDLSQPQPVEQWEQAHQQCLQRMSITMQEDTDIVLDDTNCFKWLRDRFRGVALQYQYDVITVYINVPLAELERRRQHALATGERNSLADAAFYPVIRQFEIPDASENTIVFDASSHPLEWIKAHLP